MQDGKCQAKLNMWRRGSGALVLGTFFIVVFFTFIMMFCDMYVMREGYLGEKAAADAVADGTALYAAGDYSVTYSDAEGKKDEIAGVIEDGLGVSTGSMSMMEDGFEDENTVTVQAGTEQNLVSGLFGSSYAVSTESATEFTRLAIDLDADVAPGPAGTTDRAARLYWLFDGPAPTTAAGMQRYLTSIDVPVLSSGGSVGYISIRVHRKLADEYMAVFEDMAAIGFPVYGADAYSFRPKNNNSPTPSLSEHSYGSAIDINVAANPSVGITGPASAYQPYINQYSVTPEVVAIWKSHGFYWGGDWSASTPTDYMHFTYCGG